MKLQFSRKIFEKYSNMKFQKNPTSGSRVVPCGRSEGQISMMKLIVSFGNFRNASKTLHFFTRSSLMFHITFLQQRAILSVAGVVAEGMYELVVGVSGPKIRQEFPSA
jgi:hypothetical protein